MDKHEEILNPGFFLSPPTFEALPSQLRKETSPPLRTLRSLSRCLIRGLVLLKINLVTPHCSRLIILIARVRSQNSPGGEKYSSCCKRK